MENKPDKSSRAKTTKQKKFQGVVVSDLQDKTVVVRVDTLKIHRKYHKRYTRSKKYQVHDQKNECQNGDLVEFVQCAPKSRTKKWRIVKKVKGN